jgi:hypothetical protein
LVLLVALISVAAAFTAARAGATTPATVTYTLSTASNEITSGTRNQGFWCTNFGSSDTNDDYFTGNANGFYCNDYFSFSLAGYANPCTVESAVLNIPAFSGSDTGTKTLGLFDVSTDPLTLAAKHNNPNSTIYNDLGTGTTYGSYSVDTGFTGTFHLALNPTGLAALQQAKVTHQSYFSLGGSITDQLAGDFLFSGSTAGNVTLTLTIDRICRVS